MSHSPIASPLGRSPRASVAGRAPVRRAATWAVILLPAAILLAFLPRFGAMQNNDYFGSITSYLGSDYPSELARAKRYLTGRSNEHRIAVPMLVYHTNFVLTRGSNRPLTAFTWLLMAVVFATLYRLLPIAARRAPPQRALLGFVLAAFCFTPVAAHNLAMGFSGTMWFLANVFFVAALAALVRRGPGAGTVALWPVAAFGLFGLFSYSTSLSMWPALVVAALCLRLAWRQVALLAVLAGLSYAYYFATYAIPQTAPNTDDAGAALTFFGIYLGGLFTPKAAPAAWIGWGGAVAAAGLLGYVLVRRRDRLPVLAPWLAIQTFGLVNAIGTAVGRSGFGERMAVSSRYATLPALFWAGLLVTVALLIIDADGTSGTGSLHARRRQALVALLGVFLSLAIPMWARGLPLLEAFARRARHQQLAELALLRGHYDPQALRTLSPVPAEVWKARATWIRLGHRPFDRPRPAPPAQLEPRSTAPPPGLRGAVVAMPRTDDGALRPSGWVTARSARVAQVAVAAVDGSVVGDLVLGLPTPPEGRRAGVEEPFAGWAGYARSGSPERLRFFVRLAGDPTWYPLPGP